MGYGSPVAQNVNPQGGLQSLSTLMDLKSKQLGIQQQQQQLQGGAADVQQKQQLMQERQRLSQALQSKTAPDTGESLLADEPDPITGKPEIDANKFSAYATRDLPLMGASASQAVLKTASDKVGLASSVLGLDGAVQDRVSGVVRAHIGDNSATSESIGAEIDNALQGVNTPAAMGAAKYTKAQLAHLQSAQTPAQRNGILNTVASQFDTPTAQRVLRSPQLVQEQGKAGPYVANVNPYSALPMGRVGPTMEQGIAPAVTPFPNQTLGATGAGTGGPGDLSRPAAPAAAAPPKPGVPRTAADDAPPPNANRAVQDAYVAATQNANAHVEGIRQADNPLDYGNNMQIANQIRKLSKNTDTGPGTDIWHHILGALGAPIGANNVADYQLLGAYLDRQAAGVRGAMGLPQTNEGGAQSREIAGNTGYQGKALQDKNDLTQSLVEGLHQYRNGLDRVAGFSGQASPAAVNQFKSQWTQNFDPNVFKGELAYQRSKAEGDAFVKSLTPQEAQSLATKRKALAALSNGQLQ